MQFNKRGRIINQMMRLHYFLPVSSMFVYFGWIFQYEMISERKQGKKGLFKRLFSLSFVQLRLTPIQSLLFPDHGA